MSFADRAKAKAKQAAGEVLGDERMKQEGADEERAATQDRQTAGGGVTMAAQRAAEMESPVSDTIHNLVQTLSVKLDSAYRYGIYQQDAIREGHEDCAQVFADIATRERETIDRLIRCLQERIGDVPLSAAGEGAATGRETPGPAADPLSEPATPSAPTAPQVPGTEPGPGPQSPRMP
jgi:hypothetical protein